MNLCNVICIIELHKNEEEDLAGIYIHIPFCKQACHYCNFHFSTKLDAKEAMIDAIIQEISLRTDFLSGIDTIETIYFGGGTPSVLSGMEVERIIQTLEAKYKIKTGIEVTLEANPDDLTPEKLLEMKQAGVNRLSIGIQSFHEADLTYMNRSHSAQQARICLDEVVRAGYRNVSIDLIFGLQHSSHEAWQKNLELAVSYAPQHLSCYNLTIEPKTVFENWVRAGKMPAIDQEHAATQFLMTHDFLSQQGYDHYEISNYAQAHHISNHNTNYWRGRKYLGLGPAAHSYDGQSRYWNVSNNAKYMSAIENGELPIQTESLSQIDKYNEYLMTSFRTMWGCDEHRLHEILPQAQTLFEIGIREEMERGRISKNDNTYVLTREGMLLADQIISNLFYVNEEDILDN